MTEKEGKLALQHVLDNVMMLGKIDSIRLCLDYDEITTLQDLLSLSKDDIETLTFKKDDGMVTPISKHGKGKLMTFKRLVNFWFSNGRDILIYWPKMTNSHFTSFQVSSLNDEDPFPPLVQVEVAGIKINKHYNCKPTSYNIKSIDLVREFKKGIKRDQNLFPILNRESAWDNYHQALLVQTKAQDLEDIIISTYIPQDDEGQLLFDEKQKFMTAVFQKTLQTDKGKSIVRKYAKTSNAQKIYAELEEHHLTSTKAEAESENILNYLITSKIDDGKWKGNADSYILHWEKQVELYNDKSSVKLNEKHQRAYLEHAVKGISELAVIKTTAKTIAKQTKQEVTYDIYIDLLHDAALQYDLSTDKTHPKEHRHAQRNIYTHDVMETDDAFYDTYEEENVSHDVDTTIYELNYGQSIPTRLPRDSWFGLTRNDQNAWKNLSEERKASILKHMKPKESPNKNNGVSRPTASNHRSQNKNSFKRNINMTEFNKFISLYHTFCGKDPEATGNEIDVDNNDQNDSNDNEDHDQLYAMLTENQSNSARRQRPGNINRLLGQPDDNT